MWFRYRYQLALAAVVLFAPTLLSAAAIDDADADKSPAPAVVTKPVKTIYGRPIKAEAAPSELAQAPTPAPKHVARAATAPTSSLGDRLELRLALHRIAAQSAASDQSNIATVLASPQMVDAAATILREEYDSQPQTSTKATGAGTGPILSFIEYLIENPQILTAFISAIIALFGGV